MAKMDPHSLLTNDTGVLECQVNRYQMGSTKRDNTWPTWYTAFNLCSIKKVWGASGGISDEEESEEEVMQRIDSDEEGEGY